MNNSINPYSTPSSDVNTISNTIHIPFLKSWAIFALITNVGGLLAGFLLGAIIAAIMSFLGIPAQFIQIAGGIGGFIIGLLISYVTYKWSVKKYIIYKFVKESDA